MELYILNSLFNKDTIIEDYEELVWTERFRQFGEFKCIIPASKENIATYTPGLYLGSNKTDRVMLVETVENSINDEGVKKLTLSGRSAEFVLSNRIAWGIWGPQGTEPEWSMSGTPIGIINSIVYDNIYDSWNDEENIPNLLVSSLYPADNIPAYSGNIVVTTKKPMTVYDYIRDIAIKYNLGFRIYRGPDNGKLYYNTYRGVKRDVNQTTHPPVIFSPSLDSLVDTKTIRSKEKYVSQCYVFSESGETMVSQDESYVFGLDLRVIALLVEEPEELTTFAEWYAYREQKGYEELKARREYFIMDGEVPQVTNYIYHVNYNLGDLVTMRDEVGNENTMRVTEQIFTKDASGEKAYPTLEKLTENE